MEKKLHIHLTRRKKDEIHVEALSEDKTIWYVVPEIFKNINKHKELKKFSSVNNAIKSITKLDGYRKIAVKINEEMKNFYWDEDGNFCIKEIYLEEYIEKEVSHGERKEENTLLLKKIEELEEKLKVSNQINLNEIEKKFLLEKFEGNQDAKRWLEAFEKECDRYHVTSNELKIEILKLFISGNVKDWYQANVIKLKISDWEKWKESFLLNFKRNNWVTIRTAFNFRYMKGSIMDYLIKKERLLLEADGKLPEMTRIYLIVYGLPIPLQEKLDREKILNMKDLIDELKKYDDTYKIKEETRKKQIDKITNNKSEEKEKKPCDICEKLGFKNRYHPTKKCWNNKSKNVKEVNMNRDSTEEEPENEDLNK